MKLKKKIVRGHIRYFKEKNHNQIVLLLLILLISSRFFYSL